VNGVHFQQYAKKASIVEPSKYGEGLTHTFITTPDRYAERMGTAPRGGIADAQARVLTYIEQWCFGKRDPASCRFESGEEMPEPIIIIDSSEVREGRVEELKKAMDELVAFAEANEPRMIAYAVYFSEEDTCVTVVQAHPDSASAEFHMEVAGSVFAKFVDLIRMSGIAVYGRPSDRLLERLHKKAEMWGSGTVVVHDLHAGFARFEVRGLMAPDAPGVGSAID
jgi:hypothetical protein